MSGMYGAGGVPPMGVGAYGPLSAGMMGGMLEFFQLVAN
ncbi:unnamed protein product [Cylicostephanus goldi]|uniref:Uncharacterized protein n=1 Tax=Cylicostephanus goldi TaxID=71465 RepID=A0A3P6V608_CYLGO|nr:unnamed protein product [Cylicostephanus goldi]